MGQARSKVSVLGAGHVGSAVANALVLLRVCDLVMLYDRDLACAEGQAWDIGDAVPLLSEMEIVPTAEYGDLADSDVVVIGMVLDGARLRHQLGKLLGVDQDSVHAHVIGEHGDSSFPVWSSVTVGAIRLDQYGLPDGTSLPVVQHDLAAAVRSRGRRIHERKGFTSYGVAAAVARIVRAIVRDEKRIFMVSVLAAQEYGIGPVALSLPSIVGRGGIARQLVLTMSEEERRMLERSATILDQAYKSLSPGKGTTTREK